MLVEKNCRFLGVVGNEHVHAIIADECRRGRGEAMVIDDIKEHRFASLLSGCPQKSPSICGNVIFIKAQVLFIPVPTSKYEELAANRINRDQPNLITQDNGGVLELGDLAGSVQF